jgi:hypothetical protein
MKIKFIRLKKSNNLKYKYTITLLVDNKQMDIEFGARGYEDYTIHKNDKRKELYIDRHKKNENWNDPLTKGTLSKYILWNKKTIKESLIDYLDHFKISA